MSLLLSGITTVVARIAPIVLIIVLGNLIRARSLISAHSVDELRRLVVNVALPPVLFVAFLDMQLESAFIGLFVTLAAICIALLGAGYLLLRVLPIKYQYFPFLITGFEFEMVGITLFGTAYGLSNLGYIAIVDLGHELFIWFVLATLLAALALNVLGAKQWFYGSSAGAAILETLHVLGNLLIPMILILIGYGMSLSRRGFREAVGVVFGRLAVLVPLALLVNKFVVRGLLDLGPAFEKAVFTFFVLPPPYIIMLFINVLSVYTAVSLVIFIVYFAINPSL